VLAAAAATATVAAPLHRHMTCVGSLDRMTDHLMRSFCAPPSTRVGVCLRWLPLHDPSLLDHCLITGVCHARQVPESEAPLCELPLVVAELALVELLPGLDAHPFWCRRLLSGFDRRADAGPSGGGGGVGAGAGVWQTLSMRDFCMGVNDMAPRGSMSARAALCFRCFGGGGAGTVGPREIEATLRGCGACCVLSGGPF
jgi:hypothetical protein